MKSRDVDLEEYARARLAYLTAGQPPLAPGPRRATRPVTDNWPAVDDEGHRDDGHDGVDEPPRWTAPDAPATGGRAALPGATLAGRAAAFARGHVVAVALVVLVGLLATAGWMLRARAEELPLGPLPPVPTPVALPSTITTSSPAPGRTPSVPATPGAPSPIEVHVLGAVRRPGVVRLPPGARVQDAILAAGGLAPGAAPGELNLAAVVVDADQLVIGTRDEPRGELRHGVTPSPDDSGPSGGATTSAGTSGGGTVPAGAPAGAATTTVDLNTATVEQLDQLPGVGPVTAQRILAFRAQHQRFGRVEELQEVDGIGPKTYAQIAPHVRV